MSIAGIPQGPIRIRVGQVLGGVKLAPEHCRLRLQGKAKSPWGLQQSTASPCQAQAAAGRAGRGVDGAVGSSEAG